MRWTFAAFGDALPEGEELPLIASLGAALQPYWLSLATSLTELTLTFKLEIGCATTSALNQLTRLRDLSLFGARNVVRGYPKAHVELSLPQLETLEIFSFSHVWISLKCLQLEKLLLVGLHILEVLQGLPHNIKRICLNNLGEGSLSLEEILQRQRLEQLTALWLWLRPETYEEPSVLEVIKGEFKKGRLQGFATDCPLENLTPLRGPQCALPFSLMYLKLHLPLEKGLPLVLEQLTGLKTLEITDAGEGRMHLDRPLDPFLDIVLLRLLTFSGKAAKSLDLTPDASMFLALAKKRTEEGTLKPRASGKELVLNY